MRDIKEFENRVINGDCIEVMKTMPDNSVDTIITDPPYGLEFMGKEWDKLGAGIEKTSTSAGGFSRRGKEKGDNPYANSRVRYGKDISGIQSFHYEWAKEALRVIKPGGTLLCFGGSRTYHRIACGIEDAGWVIKDCIMWLYGSGFPKATVIRKQLDKSSGKLKNLIDFTKWFDRLCNEKRLTNRQIDKYLELDSGGSTASHYRGWNTEQPRFPRLKLYYKLKKWLEFGDKWDKSIEEAEREVVGKQKTNLTVMQNIGKNNVSGDVDITISATPEAKLWNGWKSHGLKPAYEPIIVAMKPNDGTYANNALKWEVSGLNIDGGRIEIDVKNDPNYRPNAYKHKGHGSSFSIQGDRKRDKLDLPDSGFHNSKGRFPANIILDEQAAEMLDQQSGVLKSGGGNKATKNADTFLGTGFGGTDNSTWKINIGGASRFFYVAKASKSERNMGCEGLDDKPAGMCMKDDKFTRENMGNKPASEREPIKNNHPTVKPLKLMEYLCTLTKTPTGGIVLDPFLGSGTTAMAAKKTGRTFIGIEQDKDYCKIAEARIKAVKVENKLPL